MQCYIKRSCYKAKMHSKYFITKMQAPEGTSWSFLINYIIRAYFADSLTVCLLWNENSNFNLGTLPTETSNAFLSIKSADLRKSIKADIFNFSALEEKFHYRAVEYDELVLKLTAAIQHAFCEAYVVFQEEIPIFVKAFHKAVSYANWRLRRVKFLFAFYKAECNEYYFDDTLFADQPNLLVIEAASRNSTKFDLKTNKFVGSRYNQPEELYTISTYDAVKGEFSNDHELYFNKLRNLQGREIVMAGFDYRPMVVYDYNSTPQWYDHAADNTQRSVFIDGTEVQVLLHFCWLYNCTVEVDTSEKGNWGMVYPNGTGEGLIGMVLDGTVDIAFDGLYLLETDYIEATNFFGRSGISCLVPRPIRKSSWAMLLRPFQFTLWLGVAICLIVEILALFSIRQVELNFGNQRCSVSENFTFGLSTTFQLLISQSTSYIVSTPALRTVLLACYMIDIVIESVYNGGLAAILTIPTFTEAADTLERLSKHNLMWTATSGYWVDTIAQDTNPIIHNVYKNFRVNSFDNMREYAKTKDMAFAVERLIYDHLANGEYLTPAALDRLKLMQDDIYFQYTMPFVGRLWPLLEKYNNLLDNWHAFGFVKYWEWKIVADYIGVRQQEEVISSSVIQIDDGPVQLGLDNFAGLILVWFIGVIISIISFLLELFYYKRFKRAMRETEIATSVSNEICI